MPFSKLFLDSNQSFVKLLIVSSIINSFFVLFIILRLFLGWNYIKQRLNDSTIFYEESSWYDGRVWTKSKSILFQEKLIYIYQVLPTINKIKKILIGICFLFLTLLLLLNF